MIKGRTVTPRYTVKSRQPISCVAPAPRPNVFLTGPADESARIAQGCAAAKGPWLLVLRPGLRLGSEWAAAAKAHMTDHPRSGAHFRLALDDHRPAARLREAWMGLVGQGGGAVLIPKAVLEKSGAGATRPLPARVFRIEG